MKIDLSNIKNIIFDLGNVLLNLDFDASIKAFQKLGSDGEVLDHKNAYSHPVFYNFEVGKISPAEFRTGIRRILNRPDISDETIDRAWYAMILDIPAKRVKVLQELDKKYNIYLFSNTNQIHIDNLLQEFKAEHGIDFPSLFKGVYYSHEIHDRKPELSSFKKVIELSGVKPEETLFVDDLEKNIIGAEQAGLKTLWLKKEMEMAELF
ncbi:HAD family phosphatase [Prolixibacteraceae bacterium Z1-6]|uniref:HAD family phosphatase n=1 Tax=Draconibacterium aestuarii TaxID=2998507 RepID=A0A9X3F741_9BACT|nr:HAD family phosphatase [Prolixibacteraceae bacterium Z1-6]